MNVKNKIVALVMSFCICFCTVSNSFAYDKRNITTVSAPLVAVVSTVAVACGVAINDNTDLYDVASIFYEKYKNNQEIIKNAFDLGVSILGNKVVTVSKEFMELIKSAFDDYSIDFSDSIHIPNYGLSKPIEIVPNSTDYVSVVQGAYTVQYNKNGVLLYYENQLILSFNTNLTGGYYSYDFMKISFDEKGRIGVKLWHKPEDSLTSSIFMAAATIPYFNAFPSFKEYDWDKISDKVEQGSVGLHMPGYLGDLIGKNPSDVVYDGVNSNPYDKPYEDTITLPNVNNPSIDSTLEGTFNPSLDSDIPGTSNPSVPNEGIWSTIKDFVVSLVVPSDTFWTDLFTGFSDNLHKNFPMLDMSAFDSLLVDGKPFPNIFAFGGKIVDGDTINSIVDWLRPIVAGFVMLLLLFFNYRKLHKIIRNSDPYGSVAEKGCTSNVN